SSRRCTWSIRIDARAALGVLARRVSRASRTGRAGFEFGRDMIKMKKVRRRVVQSRPETTYKNATQRHLREHAGWYQAAHDPRLTRRPPHRRCGARPEVPGRPRFAGCRPRLREPPLVR